MPPLTILLLGGSGFVGRALLRELALLPAGAVRVRALLRTPDAVAALPFLEKVQGSLEHLPTNLAPGEPYVLVHLAVKHIDRDGSGFIATNVDATRALLDALRPPPMGIVYGSSMSVYGQGAQDGIDEGAPTSPDTPLGESRIRAEQEIATFARRHALSAFSLRPRFVLGDGDRFVIPALAKLVRRGIGIGSGQQRFSVIDVADYARVIVRLAKRAASGSPIVQSLNVGYERPVSFAEIAASIADATGAPSIRFRIPVSRSVTRVLHRLPVRAIDRLATRIELVGLSHWGTSAALAAAVGGDLVRIDSMSVVRRAAALLAPLHPISIASAT